MHPDLMSPVLRNGLIPIFLYRAGAIHLQVVYSISSNYKSATWDQSPRCCLSLLLDPSNLSLHLESIFAIAFPFLITGIHAVHQVQMRKRSQDDERIRIYGLPLYQQHPVPASLLLGPLAFSRTSLRRLADNERCINKRKSNSLASPSLV
ncbi:MAG: hypothetical protein JOS17DRAFT_209281 [Linnemannia elongata]|nr:MAG: hypothetical protein JOS17DRAFT_209281 [Linnemannia elongata]